MKINKNNTLYYSDIKKDKNMLVDLTFLNNYPLNGKECFLLINLEHDTILFQKGMQNLLGHDDHNNSELNFLLSCCHPDDYQLVEKILNTTLSYSNKNRTKNAKNKLFISLRLRKKDNNYTKILCKFSVNSTDQFGRILSVLVVLTDVSFMDQDHFVKWTFEAKKLNFEEFKNNIYKSLQDVFTKRELEVIKEVCKKIASEEIAKNLFISRHTVATHRKNILKKSKCHSVNELIKYCNAVGIDTFKGK